MSDSPIVTPLSRLTWQRVLIPVTIGLLVTSYLIYNLGQSDLSTVHRLTWTRHVAIGLGLAILTVIVRDIAYIYRIWLLTDRQLSFIRCFQVIMLWEFGSSVTPASVGGITLALFILNKEKISFGKGAAIVLLCSYLDNIAFVMVFSLLYLLLGNGMFDLSAVCIDMQDKPFVQAFRSLGQYVWIVFLMVAIIGGLLGFSIFVKPQWAKSTLDHAADWKMLRRWRGNIHFFGEEIRLTSIAFKDRGLWELARLIIITTVSWCSRYSLAIALLWTFNPTFDYLSAFARQYIHRLIVMVPATPGGSGIAEAAFLGLNCDYMPIGLSLVIVLIWRLLNFYLYIGIGGIVLPLWLARVRRSE